MRSLLFLLLMVVSPSVLSYDRGTIVNVEPVYRTHTTYEYRYVCDHMHNYRNETGNAIVGGLIGGAVGRQFGGGRGRDATTIAGAVIGSQIGRNSARDYNNNRRYSHQSCYTREYPVVRSYHAGYNVTYRVRSGRLITRFQMHYPY